MLCDLQVQIEYSGLLIKYLMDGAHIYKKLNLTIRWQMYTATLPGLFSIRVIWTILL